MRHRLILLLTMLVSSMSFAQDNFYFSQYFQVGPAINPAFTGIDNFLDVKVNYRNQWAGFGDSPSTNYIGVNGYLKKESTQSFREYALRISNPDILDSLSRILSIYNPIYAFLFLLPKMFFSHSTLTYKYHFLNSELPYHRLSHLFAKRFLFYYQW